MAFDDSRKLKMLVWTTGLLCALALVVNVTSEFFLPDIGMYVERRIYFDQVISKKGLSMHKVKYWRKVKE